MQIIHSEGQLQSYLLDTVPELVPEDIKARYPNDKTGQINTLLGKNPLLFDSYLTNAIEVDVDCLCDGKDVFVSGIMEHIEEAGIHSGDSACSLPVHTLSNEMVDELERQTKVLAKALNVGGLMNVQFAVKDGTIYILEVNRAPRAPCPSSPRPSARRSPRSPPASWPAKSSTRPSPPMAKKPDPRALKHIAVKEAVFPFARFPASIRCSAGNALRPAKSWASTPITRWRLPSRSSAPASISLVKAPSSFPSATATRTASCPPSHPRRSASGAGNRRHPALPCRKRHRGDQDQQGAGRPPHIEDAIRNRQVQLVFNTTDGNKAISDSKSLRRAALMQKVPYYTTMSGSLAAAEAIRALKQGFEVRPLPELF